MHDNIITIKLFEKFPYADEYKKRLFTINVA